MKITVIGTTCYQDMMVLHKVHMEDEGHEVSLPAFDNHEGFNEIQVCEYNRGKIEWADEVHVVWDARSTGTIFDLGMCFAMRKPVRIIYLNDKTFVNLLEQYSEVSCKDRSDLERLSIDE